MGGWNKGIKNSTGGGFTGKKHSDTSIEKMKSSSSASYQRPRAQAIDTTHICEYGCGKIAKYIFSNSKLCCSLHFNSCPGKVEAFRCLDHSSRTSKSLDTRIRKGITKTSRVKAHKTMIDTGGYARIASKTRTRWAEAPWENNPRCPLLKYKETELVYQGTYEFRFLEDLERQFGLEWLIKNVRRGPSIWYYYNNEQKLYISDFIIDNTIYEIKSLWTWNKKGRDKELEHQNKCKISACLAQNYQFILILEGKKIHAPIMD